MIETDQRVRIRPAGVSVFRVVEIDGDQALIEAADAAPGRYSFRMPVADLIPADPPE